MKYFILLGCAIVSVLTDTMADTSAPYILRAPRILSQSNYRPRPLCLYNDVAREALAVDEVHKGLSFKDEIIPFTGKGVVVSIVDCGIDPRHPAFTDYNTGNNRVALYVTTESSRESESGILTYKVYKPAEGEKILYKNIDKGGGGHGTHTTGTAAGSFMGNPYYGIAPDATLVLTSIGDAIFDDEILFGIKTALDYSRGHNMPCVTSLSLGSTAGMHDGSGPLTDMLAEEMLPNGQIVCFAAGNDGSHAAWISRDFSENPNPLVSAFIRGGFGTSPLALNSMFTGIGEEWRIGLTLVKIGPSEWTEVWRSSMYDVADFTAEPINILTDMPEIASHLKEDDSFIEITKIQGYDNLIGVELYGQLSWQNEDSKYTVGVVLDSPSGGIIDGYTSFSPAGFADFGIEGYTKGLPDESISDHCTSPYVVSVGAFNARESYTVDGKEFNLDPESDGEAGHAALYSSYGSKPDILPHTIAPGTNIISALSPTSSYTRVHTEELTPGTRWSWGVSTGTSMSTPAIAGMIALWLQADPTLSRDDVLQLLEQTGDVAKGGERSRFGMPSAYMGLKAILDKQSSLIQPGFDNGQAENAPSKLMVKYINDTLIEAVLPFPAAGGEYSLTATDGRQLASGSFTGNSFTLSLPHTYSIAILTAVTPQGTANQKLVVTQ